jgi:hypothetical protein
MPASFFVREKGSSCNRSKSAARVGFLPRLSRVAHPGALEDAFLRYGTLLPIGNFRRRMYM